MTWVIEHLCVFMCVYVCVISMGTRFTSIYKQRTCLKGREPLSINKASCVQYLSATWQMLHGVRSRTRPLRNKCLFTWMLQFEFSMRQTNETSRFVDWKGMGKQQNIVMSQKRNRLTFCYIFLEERVTKFCLCFIYFTRTWVHT